MLLCVIAGPVITNFSIPIVLAISNEDKERFHGNGSSIAFVYKSNIIGMLQNCEFFPHRKVGENCLSLLYSCSYATT